MCREVPAILNVLHCELAHTANSDIKCNALLEDYLIGCPASKSLSGSVVQSLQCRIYLLLCNGGEVPVFRGVLPYQSIRFFVSASLS